ncbi:MAG: CAP domain-containing protein [Ruminococcus sp.]|nr:CAP domain-containing protein [Ruminococcus sp.]
MKKFLGFMMAAVIAAVGVPCMSANAAGMSTPPVTEQKMTLSDSELAEYANEVAVLVNKERAKQGTAPLRVLPKLQTAAQIRANEITQTFDHQRPNGTSCFSIIEQVGLDYYYVGENIAAGQSSPERVMSAWMNSDGHKSNILDADFMYIGVGVVQKGNTLYWTQEFLKYVEFSDAYIPKETEKAPQYGDLDSDGKVDSRDATQILIEYAAASSGGSSRLSSEQKKLADIDSNGKVDSKDASYVLGFYSYLSSGGKETDIRKWL